jgi:hypothetical protein
MQEKGTPAEEYVVRAGYHAMQLIANSTDAVACPHNLPPIAMEPVSLLFG